MPLFLIASHLLRRLHRRRELALAGIAVLVVILGGVGFALTQHISVGTGLYWAVTTATTVGYGDVTPHNTAGRIVASAVMLITIPIVGAIFALVAGASALNRIRRLLGLDTKLPDGDYTLVIGSHPVLPHVLEELGRSGDTVVLLADSQPAGLPDDVHFLTGDPTDEAFIRQGDPARANRALIACEVDADTLVIAVAMHSLAPKLEMYALTQSPRVARALAELGVSHTLASEELVGHTLAKSLETPEAGDVLLALVDSENYRIVETEVDPTLVNRPLSEARGHSGRLVLGVMRKEGVDLGVEADPVLSEGDRLIVLQPA